MKMEGDSKVGTWS